MRVDIVFFEKANFPTVLPLVERLRNHSSLQPIFVKGFDYKEFTGFITPLRAPDGIESVDIFDLVPKKASKVERRYTRRTRRALKGKTNTTDSISFSLARFSGAPYWHDILPACSKLERALENYVKRYQPRIVIVPEDVHYAQGRLASRFFKQRGIAVWALIPPYYQLMPYYPLIGERYADRYYVMNDEVKERYRAAGVNEEKIFVIGSPYFLGTQPVARSARARKSVWFAQQGDEIDELALIDFIAVAKRLPQLEFVIKPHPLLPQSSSANARLPENVSLSKAARIEEQFAHMDCLVGVSSTSLYRAVLSGVPAISMAGDGRFPRFVVPKGQTGLSSVAGADQLYRRLLEQVESPVNMAASEKLCASPEVGLNRLLTHLATFSDDINVG